MEKLNCCTCQKPKANLVCEICQSPVCKYCAQFTDEETISFLPQLPSELEHTTYCGPCYNNTVAPALEDYMQTMKAAKEILVFDKKQGKETRLIKRLEDPISVSNCADENEAILKLAFLAAQKKLNAIVDVDLSSEKIKNGSFRTTKWRGTAIPCYVKPEKLLKDKALRHNPN